jgi:hypothetical protein
MYAVETYRWFGGSMYLRSSGKFVQGFTVIFKSHFHCGCVQGLVNAWANLLCPCLNASFVTVNVVASVDTSLQTE